MEINWHMRELPAWVVGDFWEAARDMEAGLSAFDLHRQGFYFNSEEAEDEAASGDDDDAFVSGGTLWAICEWTDSGHLAYRHVYPVKEDALAKLEELVLFTKGSA